MAKKFVIFLILTANLGCSTPAYEKVIFTEKWEVIELVPGKKFLAIPESDSIKLMEAWVRCGRNSK